MTEREKMLAGELYDCGDKELLNRWHLAKDLVREYNNTLSEDLESKNKILKKLLGNVEENDKTIEYLNSVPVTRKKIILDKILCGFIYILLMIIVVGIFNFIGLTISEDFDRKAYLLLSITPVFSSIVIFAVCLFLSTFTHKSKKTIGISLGIVFISYFLNMIFEMSESIEFLKYISIFTLADIRNVIINISINPLMIFISIVITLLFIVLSIIHYDKKELV